MVQGSLAALAQAVRRAAPRPRKAALELTDAAVTRVKELLMKRNKVLRTVKSLHYGLSARCKCKGCGAFCR
jgi:N-acetylglucosamine kinase-like BadF-type ATPase